MKFVLLILSAVTMHLSFAQDSIKVELNDLVGRWDVIYEDEESNGFLGELLEGTKEAEVAEGDNHNNAIVTFEDNGSFRLMSINDYSSTDEEGTFEVGKDGKSIIRLTKEPNAFEERDQEKMKKRKSKILYHEKDILVIKTDRGIMYMKRT